MSLQRYSYSTLYTMGVPWKPFVKGSQEASKRPPKKEPQRLYIDGNSARAVYEEIVPRGYNTCQDDARRREVSKPQKSIQQAHIMVKSSPANSRVKANESSKSTSSRTSINAILKAVEQKDLEYLLNHVTLENVNLTDEFGWTPLMSAAFCGHIEIIEFLLSLGANRKIRDRSGYTAAQLALKKNYLNVVALLKRKTESTNSIAQSDQVPHRLQVTMDVALLAKSEDPQSTKGYTTVQRKISRVGEEWQNNNGFYCKVCDATFYHASPKGHAASTLHIFNTKPKLATVYGISKQNKGYQMLLNTGWDDQVGLGPSGKGMKYPVKTYLKTDRKGLGQPLDREPRVTHFKSGDCKAISNLKVTRHKSLKKSDREKLLNMEARKERALRLALS